MLVVNILVTSTANATPLVASIVQADARQQTTTPVNLGGVESETQNLQELFFFKDARRLFAVHLNDRRSILSACLELRKSGRS